MKKTLLHSCWLILFFAMATVAADKSRPTSHPKNVRLEQCRISLIDQVTLAADRPGILTEVEFKEGQSVTAGSRVALISDEVARANLAVAEKKGNNEVEVEFAKVGHRAAIIEHNRMITANEKNVSLGGEGKTVPAMEIDKAQLAVDKAELSIQHAQHELDLNKLNAIVTRAELKTYSVNAEFDGVVTRVHKKKGEAIKQGDPVVEIVNTDRVRVEGNVALADLRFAKQGAKVLVRLSVDELDLPEEEEIFEGRITFVDVTSEKIGGTTRIFAEVQNRDNILRSGLFAEMEIEVQVIQAAAASRSIPPAAAVTRTAADR